MVGIWDERYESFVRQYMTSYEMTMLGVRGDWKWDEVQREARALSLTGAAGVAAMNNGFRYFMLAEQTSDSMAEFRESQATEYFDDAEQHLRLFGEESADLLVGVREMKAALAKKRTGFLGRKKRLNPDLVNYMMGGGFLVTFLDVARHHSSRATLIANLDPRTPPSLIPIIRAA